jgi:TolB-like protein
MKKISILFIFLMFAGVFAHSQQAATLDEAIAQAAARIEQDTGANKQIAVLNFISSSKDLSDYVINELMDIFTNHRVLAVTERSRLDAVLQERSYQTSGEVSDDEIRTIGNQLGADYIITGQMDYSGVAYRFRVFAIDIERGTRVASTSANIPKNDRQLAYFLGGSQGGNRPSSARQGERSPSPFRQGEASFGTDWFLFSLGGGLQGDLLFIRSDDEDWEEYSFGIHGGLRADFSSYILFEAAAVYEFWS